MSYMREKYTILISDRKLRLLIQKRVLCLKKIQKAKNKKDEAAMIRNKKKYDRIEKEISDWQGMLTKKYAGK